MPTQVGLGFSSVKNYNQAVKEALWQAKADFQGPRIDAAFLFATLEFSHPLVLKTLAGLLGPVPLIGCSSAILAGNQGIMKRGIALVLMCMGEDIYFKTASVKDITKKKPLASGQELGEHLVHQAREMRRDLSLFFIDGLLQDNVGFIAGLQEKLGRSFPLIGATASDNFVFKKTDVYYNHEVFSDGASGMLWGGKLRYGLGIKHGWKPLGKPLKITQATGNIVYEIDHRPAAQVYGKYLSKSVSELTQEIRHITTFYPVGIYLPGEDEYLLRNILAVKSNALIFQSNVPQDSTIRLMIGSKDACLTAASQAAEEAKKGLAGQTPSVVFVFNSTSRYLLLKRRAKQELEVIKEHFKNVPLVGIYTYGQEAPLKAVNYLGSTYFHNQTILILALGE